MNEWDVIRIPVWKYGQIAGYAIVDAADAHHAEYRWRLTDGYAVRGYSPNVIRLHREVLGLIKDDGMEADHINRDTLDNRRSNLRAVTHAQNVQNVAANQGSTSNLRGVSRIRGRWRGRVVLNGTIHHLGYFASEEEAGAAAAEFRRQHMTHAVEVSA